MLPSASRLRSAADFTAATRRGAKGAASTVVVHVYSRKADAAPRAGFVVSAKVGNSVVRHRVTRRLRPLVRGELTALPAGTDIVVRALPASAHASSGLLGDDLRAAIGAARSRVGAARRTAERRRR